MKRVLAFSFLFLFFLNSYGQGQVGHGEETGVTSALVSVPVNPIDTNTNLDLTYRHLNEQITNAWVQVMPQFPGGEEMMYKYIRDEINYYSIADNMKGRSVYISFLVDEEGNVKNAYRDRGIDIGGGCEQEAIRVIMSMPKWAPAMHEGKAIPVRITVPVKFDFRYRAQSISKDSIRVEPFTWVEKMPEFPGGQQKLLEYFRNHMNCKLIGGMQSGRITLVFTIDEKGNAKDATLRQSLGNDCDKAALDAVASMPKWEPGMQHGKCVPVRITVPWIIN